MVGEIEVDEVVECIQNDVVFWVVVECVVMQGDLVKISIEEIRDEFEEEVLEELFEESDQVVVFIGVQEIEVEVGDLCVWEELLVVLMGMEVGQKSDFIYEEMYMQEFESEDGEIEIEEVVYLQSFCFDVVEVKEKDFFEVDDELVKKVGDFEMIDVLWEDIELCICMIKMNEVCQKCEEVFFDQLCEKYLFELLEGVVN